MKRTPILAASLIALACNRERTVETPDALASAPEGLTPLPRPEPAPIAADQVVVIEQLRIEGPKSWRFDPDHPRVAGSTAEGCGVWQLGSGDFLGLVDSNVAPNPCEAWRPLQPIVLDSDPGSFSLAHPDGVRKLQVVGDRFELSGERPIVGKASKGRRYRAAAFSRDGQRLALFVGAERGQLEVDVWNLARGRMEHALDVEADPEMLTKSFWLDWPAGGLIAVARAEAIPCDANVEECGYADYGRWPDDHIVQVWREVAGKLEVPEPGEEPEDEYFAYGNPRVESVFLDPDGRWLFTLLESLEPRTGTSFSIAEIPLDESAPRSGLSWWADELDAPAREVVPAVEVREWNATVGAAFLDVEEAEDGYGGYGWLSVNWSLLSIVALPDRPVELSRSEGVIIQEAAGEHAWRIGLASRAAVLADFDICPDPNRYGDDLPPCTNFRALPDGCTAIDASWTATGPDALPLLVACDDRWLLAPLPVPEQPVDMARARELVRGTGEPRAVVWGPRGLALWTFGEGLRLFDAKGTPIATHASVVDLHRARLDEEVDRVLVREREGVRVADLASGTLGPILAWTGPVEHAAFASDGRLALAGGGALAIFASGEAEPLVQREAGKLAGLGFRQDGAILYVGLDRALPELALDVATLEGVAAAQLDRVAFQRIAAAELDPSWRWAMEEDGTILRTLDGQAIVVRSEAMMSESGWVAGDLQTIGNDRFRIGPTPFTQVYELDALAPQLVRQTLVDEFFSGKPLPRPIVHAPPATNEGEGQGEGQ